MAKSKVVATKKRQTPKVKTQSQGFETQHHQIHDGAKVAGDGKWHVAERRGFWYVEHMVGDSLDWYSQIGFVNRKWSTKPTLPIVLAFGSSDQAHLICGVLNSAFKGA